MERLDIEELICYNSLVLKFQRGRTRMNLAHDRVSGLYFKMLFSALGSMIVTTIYSSVDCICIGQYAGPLGSAAVACVNPLWPIMLAPGFLVGVGGAIMMNNRRGSGNGRDADGYFTLSFFFALIVSAIIGAAFILFPEAILRFFGAEGEVLSASVDYMRPLAVSAPTFTMCAAITPFIRGDGETVTPTVATIIGGVINVFGDIFFVFDFGLGLGLFGAGFATAIGQTVSFLLIISYFLRAKCKLKITKTDRILSKFKNIFSIGFSAFVIELSGGIVGLVFIRVISEGLSDTHLAVYGTASTVLVLFYCLFYATGTALQPIAATSHGAGDPARSRAALKVALISATALGILFWAATHIFPELILRFYMDVTDEVLLIGKDIVKTYTAALPIAGISIVASYYMQSILRHKASVVISILRGLLLPVAFVLLLPLIFHYDAIWWAIPLAEIVTVIVSVIILVLDKERA